MTIAGDPPQSDRRRGVLSSLERRLGACSLDELRVLDVVLTRMEMGRDQYGPLDLAVVRDWELEEAHEHVDGMFYRACAIIRDRDAKAAAIASAPELDDELAATGKVVRVDPPLDPQVAAAMDEFAHAEPVFVRTPSRTFDLSDEGAKR